MATKQQKKQAKAPQPERSSPLEIVTQWLAYAFWALLLLSLIWLVVILANLTIRDQVLHDIIPYMVAATLVLTPLAVATDWLYRRREPAKKAGMAAVVMVVHAVLFALIAIGTLVGAVFTWVASLLETSQDTSTYTVSLLSLVVASLLFALLFVRVISPERPRWLAAGYAAGMAVVALALLAWSVLGPVAQFVERSDDRRIVEYAPAVYDGIEGYVVDNQRLPESLSDIEDMSADAKALVDDELIEYKKGETVVTPESDEKEFRYQLCVTYQYASSDGARNESFGAFSGSGGYQEYLFISSYPAGEVCYKLKSVSYE